jgi:Flp pilus assembly pilin Flp
MLRNLFVRLWKDESGAVIATEYLMLGSIVALGSAAGMAEMRDSVIDEYKELGQSIRGTRQSYSAPAHRGGAAKTGGSAVTNDSSIPGTPAVPSAQNVTFTCPVP